MYQSIPKPPILPGHLTRVKLGMVGNLTQNEARPVGPTCNYFIRNSLTIFTGAVFFYHSKGVVEANKEISLLYNYYIQ